MHSVNAQSKIRVPNLINHDAKKYYFGLAFAFVNSNYRITKSDYFIQKDSVLSINPLKKPGVAVGLLGCYQFNKYFSVRFIPMVCLSDKSIQYVSNSYGNGPNQESVYKMESILFHLPLQLKLNSDRMNNFRFYAISGLKYDWDMSNNAKSQKTNEVFRVKPSDFGYEVGAGMEFYFSNFILSPEIKVSRGFYNIQVPDNSSQISRSMDAIRTSLVMFSLFLES